MNRNRVLTRLQFRVDSLAVGDSRVLHLFILKMNQSQIQPFIIAKIGLSFPVKMKFGLGESQNTILT